MRAFVAVVEANGFSSAARKSTMTKALLSKYVAQLESNLDTRLLQRTTRHVSTTEVGRAYYERCIPLLEELDELESSVQEIHAAPSGELKISAPISFAELYLVDLISEFSALHPKIRINLILTDRTVDIVEEGVDLAIRIGNLSDSNLIARQLSTMHVVASASPAYLDEYGEPQKPEDLSNHKCIIDSNFSDNARWSFIKDDSQTTVSVNYSCYVNSAIAAKELAIRDNGVTLSPIFAVGNDLKAGKLKVVLSDYEIENFGLYAVYAHRKHLSTKVRLFIEEAKAYFSDVPEWENAPKS